MYGLPADLDLSPLIGRELVQVCIGQYDVQLHFDGEIGVAVNDAEFTLDGRRHHSRDGHLLAPLLGVSVTHAVRVGSGDLRLTIGSHTMTIHDSNAPHYESYTIATPSGVIVV